MFLNATDRSICVVGVALSGSDGSPVVVFEASETGSFLPISVDPFDAETVIREYTDERHSSAVGWLADAIGKATPRQGRVESVRGNRFRIRFDCRRTGGPPQRFLPFGEGLALCRHLGIPLVAHEALFDISADAAAWLSSGRTFLRDFLYLNPVQYAPGNPVE